MQMGPNDVSRCVIWAISMFFFFIFHVLHILTIFYYYIYTPRKEYNTNRPKRCVKMCCLGHKYFFFQYLFHFLYILTNSLNYNWLRRSNNKKQAQTMCPAVVWALGVFFYVYSCTTIAINNNNYICIIFQFD